MTQTDCPLPIRKSLSGVTLIEMAIVLIIIGTIASILLPTLTSTVKRGKMSEARSVLYAVRDEIIGYAVEHNNTLPDNATLIGSPDDPWGRTIRYFGDPTAMVTNLCDLDSTALKYTTKNSVEVSDVAFVLASDGPDHTKDVSLGNATDGSVPDDDLLLYSTLYHLQAILCDPVTSDDNASGDDGTTISLADFINAYSSIASSSAEVDGIYVDGVVVNDTTISLGNPSGSDTGKKTYGCVWYNGTTSDVCADGNCTFGSGFRAHFVFTVSKVNSYLADGFTFSVISANSNVADSCGGSGSTLGYSSRTGLSGFSDGGTYPFVNPPKIGIEFDFYYSEKFNDPSANKDHLAILYWGEDGSSMLPDPWPSYKTVKDYDQYRGGDDNDHLPSISNSGNPSPPNYVLLDNLNEDGSVSYDVRIEINRTSNDNETGNYTTQVWFDCQDCSDLTESVIQDASDLTIPFNSTAYSTDSMVLNSTWHSKFDKVMFGWTEGTGTNRQDVTITDATFFFPEE